MKLTTPDPIEEWVSFTVNEQIDDFKERRITLHVAYQALTGLKNRTSLPTRGEIAELIEDKYCELNQLQKGRDYYETTKRRALLSPARSR